VVRPTSAPRSTFALLALLATIPWHGSGAQTPSQQAAPVFRATVDLVQVDVAVLDANRRPVEGLAATDFTILENGRPQEVAAFAAVNVPEAEAGSAPWLRQIAPDVRSNDLGDGRLFALVIDDATMPFEVRTLANVRFIARQVIDRLGPADLAAVIYTRDVRRSVDFTNDRVRLAASVEGLAAGSAYTDPQTDNWSYFSSIRTLGHVAAALATVPQRRKALIYVSTGVPVGPETIANFTLLSAQRAEGTVEEQMSEELAQIMAEFVANRPQDAYGSAMQEAFVRAQHGNVNIYSIDPAGLGGLQRYLERQTSAQQQDARTRAAFGVVVRTDPLDAMNRARLSRDYLRTVADSSGGRAILDTNDVEAGVAQIFRENSSYYLLGYRSTREPGDRRVRQVEVRVRHSGVTAHTRNAYFDPASRQRPAGQAARQLAEALSGILPAPDITLRAAAAPFLTPGRRTATLAIVVGVQHTVPGDVGARVPETLQLQATAHTPRGEPRGTSSQTARLVFRSGTGDDARYEILTRLELEPGEYQLRLAAHSAALGRHGSVYLDVHVPDFGRDALQMSGLVLAADPAWIAAPADGLADLLPVTPTTVRSFDRDARVTAFARIYDRSQRTSVQARMTDEHGAVVFSRKETLAGDRFREGAADVRLDLPISTLRTGRYLLTLVAGDRRTVTRQVRFEIE